VPFDREKVKQAAAKLAAQGVFIGTSSWKYEGWLGQLYSSARYGHRGKVVKTRFERDCLNEYGEVFKTVCVDAASYAFPSEKYLRGLAEKVPADFQFGFKVTDEITVRKFPNLDRFGIRAGKPNENFLNADLFSRSFLKLCEVIRQNVGVVMFEFSRFHTMDDEHGRDFVADLFVEVFDWSQWPGLDQKACYVLVRKPDSTRCSSIFGHCSSNALSLPFIDSFGDI
jgi:hypothetical protein